MNEVELEKLTKGFITISELLSLDIPEDISYKDALGILIKQNKLISDEETRRFNENFQTEKFKEDLKIRKAELKLSKEKQNFYETIELTRLETEKTRLEIEKQKLDIERTNQKILLENSKSERKFKYVSLIVTGITGFISVVVPAVLYYSMGMRDMKHRYRDEGISSKFYETNMKNVTNLL